MSHRSSIARGLLRSSAALALLASAGAAAAQTVPIVQPGAPGQAVRVLTAEQAGQTAVSRFSADDVRFMTDMIGHHQQAVEMAALVDGRSTLQPLRAVAGRIGASQGDEIAFMQGWLRQRGQVAPDPRAAHAGHAGHGAPAGGHDHSTMAGMATPAQMTALAAASGIAFDRLFLERMIAHHDGALTMAGALLRRPNAASDPVLFEFANEVINEQQAEIERMRGMLAALDADRRTNLRPGFRDAEQAAMNVRLVASLPKPDGFFEVGNPAGLPALPPGFPGAAPGSENRAPVLSFGNTDMAFAGDLLAVGNYHGFNLYRLGAAAPRLISSVVCPGGQGDVSIVDNLLIMSVEQTRGRVDCGREGVTGAANPQRFRGLRIFDISDPARPRQVGQVQTCRGSHTHSVVSGPGRDGSIIVYASGTSQVRPAEELAGCVAGSGDPRTSLFRIDVIEIPRANPSQARIIDSPAVFADTAGNVAGLWPGGRHGPNSQETNRTDQCHDITVFPSRNLAAGACSGNGIIFDISDPRRPRRIDAVVDPNFAYWHSATFNNDGTKVLFTDEWGGGAQPRCRTTDPRNWGANAIYDIVDNRLQFRSHQKLPAAQGANENCVAHNGSIVPVPGRDIFVQAWYQGGLSVIDFTDSTRPQEIAYFDRGPIDAQTLAIGGYWSTYYYGGRIYGAEIARGLDVLALQPSATLSANEIAAAALADHGGGFNPQRQVPVTWPHDPVVALAYVDQLQRGQALPAATVTALTRALGQARMRLTARRRDARLATRIEALASGLDVTAGDAATTRRTTGLRDTLRGVATRLR